MPPGSFVIPLPETSRSCVARGEGKRGAWNPLRAATRLRHGLGWGHCWPTAAVGTRHQLFPFPLDGRCRAAHLQALGQGVGQRRPQVHPRRLQRLEPAQAAHPLHHDGLVGGQQLHCRQVQLVEARQVGGARAAQQRRHRLAVRDHVTIFAQRKDPQARQRREHRGEAAHVSGAGAEAREAGKRRQPRRQLRDPGAGRGRGKGSGRDDRDGVRLTHSAGLHGLQQSQVAAHARAACPPASSSPGLSTLRPPSPRTHPSTRSSSSPRSSASHAGSSVSAALRTHSTRSLVHAARSGGRHSSSLRFCQCVFGGDAAHKRAAGQAANQARHPKIWAGSEHGGDAPQPQSVAGAPQAAAPAAAAAGPAPEAAPPCRRTARTSTASSGA
jgi:hypothetical protein